MKVGIINTRCSNSKSVSNAIEYLGHIPNLINCGDDIHEYKKIILPGVGSFPTGMKELKDFGFMVALKEFEQDLLGICLGMQMLFDFGYEFKKTEGLGLIPGNVYKNSNEILHPNIGWFEGVISKKKYYHVHSYSATTHDEYVMDKIRIKGIEIVSHVKYKNYTGVQFHPEKSGKEGLIFLNNFINE